MTTTDYISSISLLPTVDFLEYIAKKQWETEASYGVGLSTITPLFYSSTNSEWLCLNSESEFLESPQGTAAIKNPFSYTRPESSPVFIALNDLRVKPTQIKNAKSLFLFRSIGTKTEVITVSNYDKIPDNVTTAPPLDCFSRECLSWFSSDVDLFTGFGRLSGSLSKLIVDDNGVVLTKSEDILSSIIPISTRPCPHSNIEILGSTSTLSPYVIIQLSTSTEYLSNEEFNILFLYDSNNNIVNFIYQFEEPQNIGFNHGIILTEVRWNTKDVLII